jgi:holo-[acyl-carrier protein] synthase
MATVAGRGVSWGLAVGIDAVEIPRLRRVLARRPGVGERVFTPAERGYAQGFADPVPHLAARFAAKEAAMKALGVGLGAVAFADLEVARHRSGQPHLVLGGRAARLAGERGLRTWVVSLTHTEHLAVAVVAARGWEG